MFDINEFLNSEQNTHQFTTENVYLNQLGLGTFTTGTLYDYFNERGKTGNYVNRGVIRDVDGLEINNIGKFLGVPYSSDENWGTWEGWRKGEYTGSYEKQKFDEWSLREQNMIEPYTTDQFDLSEFQYNQQLFSPLADNPSKAEYKLNYFDIKSVPLKVKKDSRDSLINAANDHSFLNDCPLISIINMNDFMIDVKRQVPRTGDSGWSTLDGGKYGREELFAMEEYITDIKASKYKSLVCSGLLTFNLQMANGRFQCPKTEWVTYRLSLFDAPPRRSPKATAVLKSIEMAQIKRDATGRKYLTKTDGDSTPADENNPGHKTSAEMKLSYNPYLNKWESGTQSILAKIVTPIGKAFNNPTVEVLEDSDVEADLASPEETSHFAPTSGLAMPIQMQNANPFQWAPGYALDANCRAEDKVKQKVTCFNFNPKKSFKVDDTVMLSQIDGIWHCIPLGEDLDEEEEVQVSLAGQWQFQYFATNEDYFFRPTGINADKVEPQVAERAFHKMYYAQDAKNGGGIDPEDGASYSGFNTIGVVPFYADGSGYFQISSFDFMDDKIFGRRSKNGLATTRGDIDAAGRSITRGEDIADNASHGWYFGCVFPDGYDTDSVQELGPAKNFNITYQNSGVNLPNQAGTYFNGQPLPNLGELFFSGVGPGIDNTAVLPFAEEQNIEVDNLNKMLSYRPERSDQRAAWDAFPDENVDSIDETAPNKRGQYDKYEPSMFYLYNRGSDLSLDQLPADIALNASIDNVYGNPLYNIHRFNGFHKEGLFGSELKTQVKKAFNSATWLIRTPEVDVDESGHDTTISAFGLKPQVPNKIQFRPLKLELYTSYNTQISGHYAQQRDFFDARLESDLGEALWSSTAWWSSWEYNAPWGSDPDKSDNIEAKAGLQEYDRRTLLNDGIPNALYRTNAQGGVPGFENIRGKRLAFNRYNISKEFSSRRHDQHLWSFEKYRWQSLESDSYGAGAYGVIGAVTTVAVNQEITFVTNQDFGMGSVSTNSIQGAGAGIRTVVTGGGAFSVNGSLTTLAPGTNLTGAGYTTRENPSWGGSSKDYKSHNTIDLSVTVYHHHPRKQTIYDPRFFAVHHFNELPEYEGYSTGSDAVYQEVSNGQSWPFSETSNIQDTQGNITEFPYHTDPTESEIGIREPAYFTGENEYPTRVPSNTAVFKDGVNTGSSYTRLLPKAQWHLNVTRVGKLLPYNYRYYDISSPLTSGTVVTSNDMLPINDRDDPDQNHGAASLHVDKIAYSSLGVGLGENDIVGNTAYGVYFSVKEVDKDENNNVTYIKLESFDVGADIPPTSFANSDDVIKPGYNGGLPLSMVAGVGNGFRAFLLNGKVTRKEGTDLKPKALAREQQLSLPADNTPPQVVNGIGPKFGFVTGEKESTLTIASDDRSSDRKYDLFFHFHNDCSFTCQSQIFNASTTDNWDSIEQYINLTIGGG